MVLVNFRNKNFTLKKKQKKKLYGPFLWMGFSCLKARATSRRQFTFYHQVPRNWYSFYRPRKDEGLSQPWSHPVVLNTRPLDWESSALTARLYLLDAKINSTEATDILTSAKKIKNKKVKCKETCLQERTPMQKVISTKTKSFFCKCYHVSVNVIC